MSYSKPFQGDYPITSNYGNRRSFNVGGVMTPAFHDGIDFGTPQGTPIYNVDAGVVVRSQLDQFGNGWIDIVADSDGGMARFLHLSRLDVKVGQRVGTAQQIGLSGGMPGTWGAGSSTGPHLHFGLFTADTQKGGRAIDPSLIFNQWANPTEFNPNNKFIPMNNELQEKVAFLEGQLKNALNHVLANQKYNQDERLASDKDLAGAVAGNDLVYILNDAVTNRKKVYVLEEQNLSLQKKIVEMTEINKELAKAIPLEPLENSSTKPAWQSKKWLTENISTVVSALVIILPTLNWDPNLTWQNNLAVILSSAMIALGIKVGASGYVKAQAKVDEAAVKNI